MPGANDRSWDYLLIGGPSGVGKSSIAYAIARRFGIALTEVDDLFVVAETLTSAATHPALHYWSTHPEAPKLSAHEILQRQLDVCQAMSPAIVPVVENHVETEMPFILEGDFITPAVAHAVQTHARTRAAFLIEPEVGQIVASFARREPDAGEQTKRAEVSVLFGDWLQAECAKFGIAIVTSRPWDTAIDRLLDAIAD